MYNNILLLFTCVCDKQIQSKGHVHDSTELVVIVKISPIKARMPFICLKNKKILQDENKSLQNTIQINSRRGGILFPQDAYARRAPMWLVRTVYSNVVCVCVCFLFLFRMLSF